MRPAGPSLIRRFYRPYARLSAPAAGSRRPGRPAPWTPGRRPGPAARGPVRPRPAAAAGTNSGFLHSPVTLSGISGGRPSPV